MYHTNQRQARLMSIGLCLLAPMFLSTVWCENPKKNQTLTSLDDDTPYTLEWIGEAKVSRETKKPRQVSAFIYTGEESNFASVTSHSSETFEVKKGVDLELGELLNVVGVKFSISMSHKKGKGNSTTHKISMDKRSKGVVMFTENLFRTQGRARKVYVNSFWCRFGPALTSLNCHKDPEEVDVDVTTSELDENGEIVGEYWVQYMGTSKYRHPQFHHVMNRRVDCSNALQVSEQTKVKSPYECAELAIVSNKLISLYDTEWMKCYLFDETRYQWDPKAFIEIDKLVGSFDRDGHPLGNYWPTDLGALESGRNSSTLSAGERDQWRKSSKCDLILQEFVPTNDSKSAWAPKYWCKNFEEKKDSVLMFRRLAMRQLTQLGDIQQQPAKVATTTAKPTKRPEADESKELEAKEDEADPKLRAHPKFEQLNGRSYERSLGSQTVRNVRTSYDCAEQALGSEKFLATYRPSENLCILEPVQWNYGRLFSRSGKPIGPFGVRIAAAKLEQQTDDGERRQKWFSDGQCDLVHDTDEGVFTCKNFEKSDSSVVLLRKVDGYEVKRVNREHRIRENERLLFSSSQHEDFYAIKDRDFPLKCVKTQPGVQTVAACAELALKDGKQLAVYKPGASVCVLKEVESDNGHTLDRWNKPLGTYDIPFYDKESSNASKDFERWLDLNECDIIHTKREDGFRYCKQFPTTDDSILLFRRSGANKNS